MGQASAKDEKVCFRAERAKIRGMPASSADADLFAEGFCLQGLQVRPLWAKIEVHAGSQEDSRGRLVLQKRQHASILLLSRLAFQFFAWLMRNGILEPDIAGLHRQHHHSEAHVVPWAKMGKIFIAC